MKKIIGLSLILLSLSAFAKDIKVTVNGMVCSMCAQGIEKKFKTNAAVSKINVDLDAKVVTIETASKLDISDDEIKKVITEAGYNVRSIER
jgi:copper chaperone CopZ